MIGRYCYEGRAEYRIGAGCEDFQFPAVIIRIRHNIKLKLHSLRFADPVFLHKADFFRPAVQLIQTVQQVICKIGDFQKPLSEFFVLDHRTGTPAAPIHNLLVGEYGVFHRIPVDNAFLLIGETFFQKIEKELLFVLVVFRRTGSDFTRPVNGKTHNLQVFFHSLNIGMRPFRGMRLVFDGGIFGWKSESIPSHRVQDIISLCAFIAGNDVCHCVVAHVTDMQLSRWVGKHR